MPCDGPIFVPGIHNKRLAQRFRNTNERLWAAMACSIMEINGYRTVGLIAPYYVGLQYED